MERENDFGAAGADNRPAYIAYWVKDRESKKGVWHPIGAAWPHADGKGFNLLLDLQPRDGRVTLRVLEEQNEQPG